MSLSREPSLAAFRPEPSTTALSRGESLRIPSPAYQRQLQPQQSEPQFDPIFGHDVTPTVTTSTIANPQSQHHQEPVYFSPSPVRQLMASRNSSAALPPVRVDFGGPLNCELDILSPAHFANKSASATGSASGVSASVLLEQMRTNYESEKEKRHQQHSASTPQPTVKLSRAQQLHRQRAMAEEKSRLKKQKFEEEQQMLGANRDEEWEERRELVNAKLYSDFGPQAKIFKSLFMQEDIKKRRDAEEHSRAERRRENILVGRVPPPQVQPPIPAEVFTKNKFLKKKTIMDMEKMEVREEDAEDPVLEMEEIEEIEEAQFERTGQSPMFHTRLQMMMCKNRRLQRSREREGSGGGGEHHFDDGDDNLALPALLARQDKGDDDEQQQHHGDDASPSPNAASTSTVVPSLSTVTKSASAATTGLPATPMLSEGMMLSLAVSEADAPPGHRKTAERAMMRKQQQQSLSRRRSATRDDASDISDFAREEFGGGGGGGGASSSSDEDEEEEEENEEDAEIARSGRPAKAKLPESYSNSVSGLLRAVHLSRSDTQKRQLARTMQQRGCEMNNKRRLEAEERLEQQQHGTSGGVGTTPELSGTGYNRSNIDRHDPSYSATAAFIARRRNQKSIREQALEDLNNISANSYVAEVTDKFLFFKNTLMGDKREQRAESIMNRRGVASSATGQQNRNRPLLMNANELRKQFHTQAMAVRAAKQAGRPLPIGSGGGGRSSLQSAKSKMHIDDDDEPLFGRRSNVAVGSTVMLGGKRFVFDEGMRV